MKMDQRNETVSELYSALKGRYINVLLNYTTFKIYLLFLHHILFLNLNIFCYYFIFCNLPALKFLFVYMYFFLIFCFDLFHFLLLLLFLHLYVLESILFILKIYWFPDFIVTKTIAMQIRTCFLAGIIRSTPIDIHNCQCGNQQRNNRHFSAVKNQKRFLNECGSNQQLMNSRRYPV